MKASKVLVCLWLVVCSAIAFADTKLFKIETVKTATSHVVNGVNLSRMPVTVMLSLSSSSNMASNRSWPIRAYIPAGKTLQLAEVFSADRRNAYSFHFQSALVQVGDPGARHDSSAKYLIPFVANQAMLVSQAVDGPIFSHNTLYNKYAVDIVMPVGTPIVAARSGYVIENLRPYGDGKADASFLNKANFVRILHDDGTWAEYVHLKSYTANVYPGQRVEAGTPIGISGNSGFSTGPHLHFHVQRNLNGAIFSIPFQFWSKETGAFTPRYQSWIKSDASGRTSFSSDAPLRSLKECRRDGTVIDEKVLNCMRGL
jgi:murein DD-endopeptidase MepM/ murein hydrolase activator NlpD